MASIVRAIVEREHLLHDTVLPRGIPQRAHRFERRAQEDRRRRGSGLEREKVRERAFVITGRESRVVELVPHLLVRGRQRARGGERRHRLGKPPSLVSREAQVVERLDGFGGDPRRRGERRFGALQPVTPELQMPEREPGGRRSRRECGRFGKRRCRFVELVRRCKRHGEVMENLGIAGRQRSRAPIGSDGRAEAAGGVVRGSGVDLLAQRHCGSPARTPAVSARW